MKIVEPFQARGQNAVNVHEATRLVLRKRVATETPARFGMLSERVASHFAKDPTPPDGLNGFITSLRAPGARCWRTGETRPLLVQ